MILPEVEARRACLRARISTLVRESSGVLRSEQVDDREQDDPHQVDEVPVQTGQLDRSVVVRRIGAEEDDRMKMTDEQDHAAGDVRPVEAGHREEAGGEQADARAGNARSR